MSREKNILYYFTNAYPYGPGEQWKKNELDVFSKYFSHVKVVPLTYDGNTVAKELPPNATSIEPVMQGRVRRDQYLGFILRILFSSLLLPFVKEFFRAKVFTNVDRFRDWVGTCFQIYTFYNHPVFKELRSGEHKETVLYFFWGTGLAHAMVFLDQKKFKKVVIRYHGIDLYLERHPSRYIPFRPLQLMKSDLAAVISKQGKNYLEQRYPGLKFSAEVYRLGCKSEGLALPSSDNVLRIVSCSRIIPLKRLTMLSKALKYIKFNVQWKHIGDGPARGELVKCNAEMPPNIQVLLVGSVAPELVLSEYVGHYVDLFINVSESEGVPVSVMEALSAGIPVMATDVGGTSEIVNDNVGKLLPANIIPEQLAAEIQMFFERDVSEKMKLREKCFAQYEKNCNAEVWATRMATSLTN